MKTILLNHITIYVYFVILLLVLNSLIGWLLSDNQMNNKLFSFHNCKGLFWFRIFGYGLLFKNTLIHKPLFSERTGIKKSLKIKNWSVKFLH